MLTAAVIDTPTTNPTGGDYYTVQFVVSWAFRDRTGRDDVPPTDLERLAGMKRRASNFAEPFRTAILSVPYDTLVTEIKLGDWPCLEWDNSGGRVTLAGDAAHAMTMCMFPFVEAGCEAADEARQIAGKRRIMGSWTPQILWPR